jgi:hypothetical protein
LTHKVLDMASMAIEKAELFLRILTLKSWHWHILEYLLHWSCLHLLAMSVSCCMRSAKANAYLASTLPHNGPALQMTSISILNWKHMVISMMKPKWILQLYWKCFCNGLHMTLECRRDTKPWPVSGASQYLYP